jgi:hypothetical protein
MKIYHFRGKDYEINDELEERILDDFKYCEENKDWTTIENRIINGVKWGWMKKIS